MVSGWRLLKGIRDKLGGELSQPAGQSHVLVAALAVLATAMLGSLLVAQFEVRDLGWLGFLVRDRFIDADSWKPILIAVLTAQTEGTSDLYAKVYGASDFQFIYSPQALVVFDGLARAGMVNWWDFGLLNRVSLGALFALAAWTGVTLHAVDPFASSPRGRAAYLLLGSVATLLYFPVIKGYCIGQIQTWLSLLLVVSLWAFSTDRKALCGLALGLACVVKPHLGLALLWALARRELRLAAAMGAIIGLLTVASLAVYGLDLHLEYLRLLGHLSGRGEAFHANHGFNGLLNRALFLGNNLVWDGSHSQVPHHALVAIATKMWGVALVLPCLFAPVGSDPRRRLIAFGVLLLTTVLASPVAYDHHFGFTIPIFWIAATGALRWWRGNARRLLWLLGAAYFCCATFLGFTRLVAHSHFNFLQSYMLFAAVGLLAVLYALLHSSTSELRGSEPSAA